VFALTLLAMPLNPHDDLLLVRRLARESWLESVSTPFLGDSYPFYRPLLNVFAKLLIAIGGYHSWAFRVPQIAMLATFLGLVVAIGRRLALPTRFIALRVLGCLGSRFLYSASHVVGRHWEPGRPELLRGLCARRGGTG
jgi:hypothetical protein